MSQYYQYALNLTARLIELVNSIGYQPLMDYLQDFKRTQDSSRLLERTGLRYSSFSNLESVWNRAKLYLNREGNLNEQIEFAQFWPLPNVEVVKRIDFFDYDNEVENDFNLVNSSESHIGLIPDCAFYSDELTLSKDANIAYVRSKNISRIDILLDNVTINDFIDMMDKGPKETLKLIQYEGMVSLMVYYQINKAEFVSKVSEFTEMKILSTVFRDFSLNDGFQQSEAYLELLQKLTRLSNSMSPSSITNPNGTISNIDYDIDLGDDEASYRKKLVLAGAIDADEEFTINVVGFTIKSYWSNLGRESENYEAFRE